MHFPLHYILAFCPTWEDKIEATVNHCRRMQGATRVAGWFTSQDSSMCENVQNLKLCTYQHQYVHIIYVCTSITDTLSHSPVMRWLWWGNLPSWMAGPSIEMTSLYKLLPSLNTPLHKTSLHILLKDSVLKTNTKLCKNLDYIYPKYSCTVSMF